ncbi:hypothetical protein HDU89_006573 [Geranomyces variabilis]|nr:hypothetical protein HDU89_006573 [Geranomyces variabilis]
MPELNLSVAVIGAGVCGLAAAIRVRELGITQLTIYEKDEDVGGTWLNNRYPGCGCDVESHLYSFSFAQNPNWSTAYAGRAEIHQYVRDVVADQKLLPHIRFRTRVVSMSWSAAESRWRLKLAIRGDNGSVESVDATASVVICAMGPLSVPSIPPNIDPAEFDGPVVHTNEWDESVQHKGKRVAVIGNAASGVQVIGAIVDEVESLTVLQRTPNWVLPRWNPQHSTPFKWVFAHVPGVQRVWRTLLYLRRDLIMHKAFRPSNFLAGRISKLAVNWMKSSVPPELHDAIIPNYRFGCKRIIVSNAYLPAISSPKTTLVTTPIQRLAKTGVLLTDGTTVPADLVVLATGFQIQKPFTSTEVIGPDETTTLAEKWANSRDTYLGITAHGYPNMYLMLGPYTGLGHSSVLTMAELQAEYVARVLRRQMQTGTPAVAVTKAAEQAFVARCEKGMDGTAWKDGGCVSWYLDKPGGSPSALWPWTVFWYWWTTRKVVWSDYEPKMVLPLKVRLMMLIPTPQRAVKSLLLVLLAMAITRRFAVGKGVHEWMTDMARKLVGR